MLLRRSLSRLRAFKCVYAIFVDCGDVVITQSEWPTLYKEGHKFRHFPSKISGSHAGEVEIYLSEVYNIVQVYFSGEVHWYRGQSTRK